ncbi:flagellar basal body P-ring formation chaperone FlgA [Actibacterium sp. 188UL27-1]|uniref:flagellar basal body P-ring formation chaperone FlgA n=1 Tax=Actibacterium sp. 188UL27-1 TaxID=2786961 RepID=UPI001959C159|nr:flagellar basal body P-ring formation chaperone FlgA [Actibacterium sp. 188UL27-1]MBM7066210.1 flagellar basal body P-ring formation protein FlgA [Actibacterium sp. 188UL27-1]
MLIRTLIALAFVISGSAVAAETLIAARTIRPLTLLSAADVTVVKDKVPGALQHPLDVVGMEARVALYAGRPIRPGDVGPPALVERNQIVTLLYDRSGLRIATEARALGRAGEGDTLRVMNLSSRSTVSGRVDHHGRVIVGPSGSLLEDMEKN